MHDLCAVPEPKSNQPLVTSGRKHADSLEGFAKEPSTTRPIMTLCLLKQNANAAFWLLLFLGGYLGGENSVGGFSPMRRRLPISNSACVLVVMI